MCQQAEAESNYLMWRERRERERAEEQRGFEDGADGLPRKAALRRAQASFHREAYLTGYEAGSKKIR